MLSKPSKRLIVRHALFSSALLVLYLLLNRPEVILISHLGFTAWYPATGLTLATMLGISPWYAFLVCFVDSLAGAWIYHLPVATFSQTIGAASVAVCYGTAAFVLRGPLRIDPGLRRRQDVVRYVFVTIATALVATAIGVGCLVADHSIPRHEFWQSASGWFFGDAVGLLGVAPFLLVHVLPWIRRQLSLLPESAAPAVDHRQKKAPVTQAGIWLEALAQAAAISVTLWAMFGPPKLPLYLSFVPIIWIAMRQGIRRAVTGVLALNFGIVVAMNIFPPEPSTASRVGLLMLVVSAVGLIVGSAVTERHRMGLALYERTFYLNALIENSPLGIAVLDRQGRVELTNVALEKLFLYEQPELAGRDLDSLLSIHGELEATVPTASLVLAGQTLHENVRRKRKDGTVLDLEMHAVPLVVNRQVQGAYTIYKDISEQIKSAEAERKHADSLSGLVRELQLRSDQMSLLNEMARLLECCQTTQEASVVVGGSMQKLFPETLSGRLYLFRSSRNLLEAAAQWGKVSASEMLFAPNECWALRRGQPHMSTRRNGAIPCPHLAAESTCTSLCVPMVAQGDILGTLHLEFSAAEQTASNSASEALPEAIQRLALTASGQIALSLASLRLRETLRDQSIRDPLTGLFNRRFMEESLDRELQRATRKQHPVSVLFLDLDHFKKFNDTFGHDAGDFVLRSVAELFRNFFRADDVICRYGGEEFAIILPESSPQSAAMRANALREQVKKLKLQSTNQNLGTVTVSIGISTFPDHGLSGVELLKVADRCLYQSKKSGRDAVTLAAIPQQV
jgi:diguanylate cyclase (GGDEF)-like protein/PAS domain S-box-containing protein